MLIDLNLLNIKDEIKIDEEVTFPKEDLDKAKILDMKKVKVTGKIIPDLDDYQMLIDVFGLENLEKALQNEKLTTSEFANSLFESVDREQLNLKNSLILRRMDDSITFFKATGMELSEIKYGISPEFFKRKGLNYKNMISIY